MCYSGWLWLAANCAGRVSEYTCEDHLPEWRHTHLSAGLFLSPWRVSSDGHVSSWRSLVARQAVCPYVDYSHRTVVLVVHSVIISYIMFFKCRTHFVISVDFHGSWWGHWNCRTGHKRTGKGGRWPIIVQTCNLWAREKAVVLTNDSA